VGPIVVSLQVPKSAYTKPGTMAAYKPYWNQKLKVLVTSGYSALLCSAGQSLRKYVEQA